MAKGKFGDAETLSKAKDTAANRLVEAGEHGSIAGRVLSDRGAPRIAFNTVLADIQANGARLLGKESLDSGEGMVWAFDGPFGLKWFMTAYTVRGSRCRTLQLNAMFTDEGSNRRDMLEHANQWNIDHRYFSVTALDDEHAAVELDIPPGVGGDIASREIREIWLPGRLEYRQSKRGI
jgi:hypothetical protein